MTFFEYIKVIYTKESRAVNGTFSIDVMLSITLSKWLSFDKHTLHYLPNLLKYRFFIEPLHYFYLLYYHIPAGRVPFLKRIEKVVVKDNKIYNEIKDIFKWSNRELEFNRSILEKIIMTNKKYWKEELGVG